jgi:ribonuclease P protein component
MRREQRLRRGVDFERVRANRRSWAHPLLVCYERFRRDADPTRVGIVVGRRVGKAATRNRIKRLIREAVRALYPRLLSGYDLIVIARQPAASATLADLTAALESIIPRTDTGRGLRSTPSSPLTTSVKGREDAR